MSIVFSILNKTNIHMRHNLLYSGFSIKGKKAVLSFSVPAYSINNQK